MRGKIRFWPLGISALLGILVLASLLLVVPGESLAMTSIELVNKKRAQELGIEVRARAAGPNAVWVEMECDTKDALKYYSHVELAIHDGKRLLLSSVLRENRPTPGRVVVGFTADRSRLDQFTLTVNETIAIGHVLRVKEFVDLEKIR